MNSADRRCATRVPVSMYLQQHIEGRSHRCFMTDISMTGLYMERPITSYVRHSAAIDLEIPLPDGQGDPIWARGEIVYDCFDALFHGTAVRFFAMGNRDRERLSAFLSQSADASPGDATASSS